MIRSGLPRAMRTWSGVKPTATLPVRTAACTSGGHEAKTEGFRADAVSRRGRAPGEEEDEERKQMPRFHDAKMGLPARKHATTIDACNPPRFRQPAPPSISPPARA